MDKALVCISTLSEAAAKNPNAEGDETIALLEIQVQRVESHVAICQALKDNDGPYSALTEKMQDLTTFMKAADPSTAVKILGFVGARLRDESWSTLGILS